jgi:serine/threonine protein kinase
MYFAPEVISSFNPTLQTTTGCCKSDIWAFGLMIIELVNGSKLWTNHLRNTNQIFSRLSSLFAFDCHKLSFNSQNSNGESPSKESLCELQSTISSKRIQSEFMSAAHWKSISADLVDVISQCLQLNPMERPSCIQLLYHPYFLPLLKTYHSNYLWAQKPFLRSMLLPDLSVENYPFDINQNDSLLEDHDEIANGNGSSNGVGDVRRNIQQLQNHNSAESLHSKFGDHHPEEIKKINSSPNVSRTKSLVNLNDQTIKDIKDNNFVEIYNFWKINGGNLLQLCKELEESPSTTRLPSFIFSSDFKTK